VKLKDAEAYFTALAREVDTPLVVALTGGMAASILADERTTDDIDFAILRYVKKDWPRTEALLKRLADDRRILVQYSSDIDRWSMVSYLDWKKHSLPYKRKGLVEIRVLDPYYWSIGKITRANGRDLDDLRAVIKKRGLDLKKMARLWVRALRKSPPSADLFNARKQMENFLGESSPDNAEFFKKLVLGKR
jgi:hypothetical protein